MEGGTLQGRSLRVRFNQDITAKTSALEIMEFFLLHSSEFDSINYITALHRIAKAADGWNVVTDPAFAPSFTQLAEKA